MRVDLMQYMEEMHQRLYYHAFLGFHQIRCNESSEIQVSEWTTLLLLEMNKTKHRRPSATKHRRPSATGARRPPAPVGHEWSCGHAVGSAVGAGALEARSAARRASPRMRGARPAADGVAGAPGGGGARHAGGGASLRRHAARAARCASSSLGPPLPCCPAPLCSVRRQRLACVLRPRDAAAPAIETPQGVLVAGLRLRFPPVCPSVQQASLCDGLALAVIQLCSGISSPGVRLSAVCLDEHLCVCLSCAAGQAAALLPPAPAAGSVAPVRRSVLRTPSAPKIPRRADAPPLVPKGGAPECSPLGQRQQAGSTGVEARFNACLGFDE
jgi:hypothetical protein